MWTGLTWVALSFCVGAHLCSLHPVRAESLPAPTGPLVPPCDCFVHRGGPCLGLSSHPYQLGAGRGGAAPGPRRRGQWPLVTRVRSC